MPVCSVCSVSVDLDEIPNYFAIHGLVPRGAGLNAVYDVGLDRLDAWARAHSIPLTLFAVGADLRRHESAAELSAMAERGHEMGNHTLDHRYDLTRLGRAEISRQIAEGSAAIARATGQTPSGFRAPGYTVTDVVYDVLAEQGVSYGSSVFPSVPYYVAKAAKMAMIRVGGRSSHSVLDTPVVLRAPTSPYRVGKPYWTRGKGVLELPIQVTRGLRLPFIGTALTLAGPARARYLTKMVVGSKFVNLELHGIDVLDADDGFPELREHQPDAAVPHSSKLKALSATIEVLRAAGYSFVRLDEAAQAFSQSV